MNGMLVLINLERNDEGTFSYHLLTKSGDKIGGERTLPTLKNIVDAFIRK